MKALVNCVGNMPLAKSAPAFDPLLTTLVDRPFIQHVVEWLVQAGFDRIDLLTDRPRPELSALLGDGTRWGVRIRMRRAAPGRALPLHAFLDEAALESALLIARGDCLPVVDLKAHRPPPRAEAPAAFFEQTGGGPPRWTGWAWLTKPALRGTDRLQSAGAWQRRMQTWASARGCMVIAERTLSAGWPQDLLDAQRAVLAGEVAGLHINGREIEPGVWMARGASVAADARLQAPLYIGEYASVRAAELGPYAVVGEGAVVSADATVANAVVEPRTFVGPHVELRDSIVRGQHLFHRSLAESVRVEADAWLQDLSQPAEA